MTEIHLSDYLEQDAIELDLKGDTKQKVLTEMVGLLGVEAESRNIALELVMSRESLGSTGIGKGIAIPHLRSTIFPRIMLAYGRSSEGVAFGSIDKKPARHFFLVASPPIDPSNLYHPILAKIVQLVKESKNRKKLDSIDTKAGLLNLIDELAG